MYKMYLQVPLYKHIADLSGRGNHVLPIPAFTLINGGKHAGNNLALRVSFRITYSICVSLKKVTNSCYQI